MRALFILFIFGHIVSAQNSDIYKRPFQSKPDFDIDVLHYDINLKIYDHEKTFYGKTSIDFKVLKSISLPCSSVFGIASTVKASATTS